MVLKVHEMCAQLESLSRIRSLLSEESSKLFLSCERACHRLNDMHFLLLKVYIHYNFLMQSV